MSLDHLTDKERFPFLLFQLIDENNAIAFSALLSTYIEGGNDPVSLRLTIPQEEAQNELENFVEERAITLPFTLLQYAAFNKNFEFVKLLHEKFRFPLEEDLSYGETANEVEALKLTFGFAHDLNVEAIAWFANNNIDFRLPLDAQALGAYAPIHAALFAYSDALEHNHEVEGVKRELNEQSLDIKGDQSLIDMFLSSHQVNFPDNEELENTLLSATQVLAILAPRSNLEQEIPVNITTGWPSPVSGEENEKIDYLSARQIMNLLKGSGVPKPLSDLFKSLNDKPYSI